MRAAVRVNAPQAPPRRSGIVAGPVLFAAAPADEVGAPAVVLQRVDAQGGRVRIGGEEWSARAYVPDQVLEPGVKVEVAEIQGATALVYE